MNFNEFKKLLFYCWRRAGTRLLILILLTSVTSILELIGFTMIMPLIDIISNQDTTNHKATNFIYLIFEKLNINLGLNSILFLILLIFLFKNLLVFISNIIIVWITTGIRVSIQNNIVNLYEKVDYRYFVSKKIGEHINLVTREAERYQSVINNLTKGSTAFISSIIFMVSIAFVDIYIILFITLTSIFFFFVFLPIFKKTKYFSFKTTHSYSNLNAYLIEFIQNFSYLKGTLRITKFNKIIYFLTKDITNISRKISLYSNILTSIKEPVGVLIIVILLYVKVSIYNESLSEVVVIGLILYRVSQMIIDIQNNWRRLNESIAGVFKIEDSILILKDQEEKYGKIKNNFIKEIRLDGVCFAYDEKKIINNCNLNICFKNIIGIQGKSGEGKTTLIKLIMGLIKPDKGNIYYDKVSSGNIDLNSLRAQIGYVSQDINLFNGSLKDNIVFWDNKKSNKSKIKKVMKLAGCFDLYNRNHENVGDQALKLSGGQKQRIIIARELYKNPKILIFDEPTSSLDSGSEQIIKKTIRTLRNKYTVILISHKQSLLKICDQVYSIKNGKTIEIKK